MVSEKTSILFYTLFNVFGHVVSLVEVSPVEDNDFRITEAIIRDTFNNFLSTFGIKDVNQNPKLNQFSTIHNFFLSITMKYFDNLKEIVNLTRVNNNDNNTRHFIAKINEVLNEGDKSFEEVDDIHVIAHIEAFITKLRYLKEINGLNKHVKNLTVNEDVLNILNTNDNFTYDINENDLNDTADNDDVWRHDETSGRRVFEGHRTRVKYFPFMASVHFFEKFQCAGSIIREDLVITAASCLQLAWNNRFFRENPAFLSVQIGCDYYRGGGEEIAVVEIYFHPEYNPHFLRNNLALLRMATHIMFSRKTGKVKRIIFDTEPSPLPANSNGITIVGWGARTASGVIYNPWINRLAFTELDFYPLRECQDIYSRDYVSEKNFCAGFFSKAGGACNRDIGGPGITGGVLVGVISFGPPICGTVDAPTVFTKVGFYNEWIDQVMKQHVPQIVRMSTKLVPKRTFALHYSDRTRKPFTMKPITLTSPHHEEKPPKANLRILQDDKLFKEFMSTMFGDKASKESQDTNKKVKAKPTSHKQSSYEIESEEAGNKKVKHKSKATKHPLVTKSSTSKDDQEEVKLQKNIVNLLDDLDLYKLMDTGENMKSDGEIKSNVNLRAKENNDSIESLGSRKSESEDGISISNEITNNNNELKEMKTKHDDILPAEERSALSNENESGKIISKGSLESEEMTGKNEENEMKTKQNYELSAEVESADSGAKDLEKEKLKSYDDESVEMSGDKNELSDIVTNQDENLSTDVEITENRENKLEKKKSKSSIESIEMSRDKNELNQKVINRQQDENLSAEDEITESMEIKLEEKKSQSYTQSIEMSGDKNELENIAKKEDENLSVEVGSGESKENKLRDKKLKDNIESAEVSSNKSELDEINTKQDDHLSEEVALEGDYDPGEVNTKINKDMDTVEKEANELAEIFAQNEIKVLQKGAEGHLDETLSQGGLESDDSNPHENEEMENTVLPSSKRHYSTAYTKRHKNKKNNQEEILSEEDNKVTKMEKRDNKKVKPKKHEGVTKNDHDSNKIRSTNNKKKVKLHRNKQEETEVNDVTTKEVTKQATQKKKRKNKQDNKKQEKRKAKPAKHDIEIDKKHKKNSKSKQKIRKSNKLNKRDEEIGKKTLKTKERKNKKKSKKQAKKKAKKQNIPLKSDLSNYDDDDFNKKNEDTDVMNSEDDKGLSIVIDSS